MRSYLFIFVLVIFCLFPAASHAAGFDDYTQEAYTCGSGIGSGDLDRAGRLYMMCGEFVRILDRDGQTLRDIRLPAGGWDVSPSPDGYYVYAVVNANPRVIRFHYDFATNNYVQDTGWQLAQFRMWGCCNYAPNGLYMDTDWWGNIYVSTGSWTPGIPNAVAKFAADGTFITAMGDYANSWSLGAFYSSNMGITVSRDGASVYTTENSNSRVQKFNRQSNGSYLSQQTWGNSAATDPTRAGICNTPSRFAAPYDITMDLEDNLYVMNTTCDEVHKYTASGSFIALKKVTGFASGDHSHGISVNGGGDVYLAERSVMLKNNTNPAVSQTEPASAVVDAVNPALTNIQANTTTARGTARISALAVDDTLVSQYRVATSTTDLATSAWKAWSVPVKFSLPEVAGSYDVYIQVRDISGKESIVYQAADDLNFADPLPTIGGLVAWKDASYAYIRYSAADNSGVSFVSVNSEPSIAHVDDTGRTIRYDLADMPDDHVSIRVQDSIGQWSDSMQVDFVDRNPPAWQSPELQWNNDKAWLTDGSIGATQIRIASSRDQIMDADWQDLTWPFALGASPGDYYIQLQDASANRSAILKTTIEQEL